MFRSLIATHPHRVTPTLRRAAIALCMVGALPSFGAQIVVLDMQPSSKRQRELAATLSPLLVAQMSRVEGMSVISQNDVRALLDLEANKSALGCNAVSCMTDIAGSLGAELLVSSTVGVVGKKVVITSTMLDVSSAKVVRRATATSPSVAAAPDAVTAAVSRLFGQGLPNNLQGPASMSRLGFRAALAGLRQAILVPGADPKGSRRRVILDLVNTELDYDAKPKLEALDLEIRRGWSRAKGLAVAAKTPELAAHYKRAMTYYTALRHDHGRVVEIRARARERGVVPSASPLRFQDPEPYDRPEPAIWEAYWKASIPARKVVAKALTAYKKNKRGAFTKLFGADRQDAAGREWTSDKNSDERYKYSYKLMPKFAHIASVQEQCVDGHKPSSLRVFVVRFREGEPYDSRSVRLKKQGKTWLIDSWL